MRLVSCGASESQRSARMTDPRGLSSHAVFASVHVKALTLVNRLSALAAMVELAGEDASRCVDGVELEEWRAQITESARQAGAILAEVNAGALADERADLGALLRDVLAPLQRYFGRRELKIDAPRLPESLFVRAEPELVRSALAAMIDVVTRPARAGERVSIRHVADAGRVSLSVSLDASAPITPPSLDVQLVEVHAWLEMRRGSLAVSRDADSVSVVLTLPRHERC